ncbi:MAG: Extracellular ligand-binding receptor, partial [Parcubacteria group bacterium GW2011_GWA1_33_6]
QNSDYGVGVFNVLKAEMEKGGVIMTNDEHFEIGSVDMRTQLTKIKSSDAELVLLAGYPKDIGQILRQASELKLDKKFFAHSGSIGPDVVKVGGTGAENLLFLYEISVNKEDQKTKSFFDRYEQKYSDSPELFSMIAYDTTVLLGEKIRECKEDVECVKNALYNTVNYPGITGLINFDNKGDIIRDLFTLFTIKEGKFVITE